MRDTSCYVITVYTDEQMELLQKISECYVRERMGQFWDLAEDLAGVGSGYKYDREDPNHETKFRAFIQRRDEAEKIFNQAYKISGASGQRTEDMNQAGDFFMAIRHARWLERPEPKPHYINDAFPSEEWSRKQKPPQCWKEDGSWRLGVNQSQLYLVQNMSENYMRERAGQFWLLEDSLAYKCAGFTYDKKNPENERRFNECVHNARKAGDLFELGYRKSGAEDYRFKTKQMMMAYDFFSVIRHALWLEDPNPNNYLASGTPLHECEEVPLIEVGKSPN